MRLLLAEDERELSDALVAILKHNNYSVDAVYDGREALDYLEAQEYDGAVLDIMMPKMDGFLASSDIRKISDAPIIMLSARDTELDKLNGFDLGIDDYITKPFSRKELIARIKAIAKRINMDSDLFIYEDLKIDYKAHSVFSENKEIKLTPKEYELLVYFIKNKNIALSRETLLSKIWGYDYYGDYRTIDTHIKMLRNNLGKYRDLIKTVRAVGYKFEI